MTPIADEIYLLPTEFIDSDHSLVQAFAHQHAPASLSPLAQAQALYYAVRDGFRYEPYQADLRREALKASHLLGRNYGYCIEKAILLAAAARAVGIPSRLGFGNVRNHIATEKLEEKLQTNVMVFHGYTELFLENKWVKATPAFNQSLCERLRVMPLEFDGQSDSVFQEFTPNGQKHMEYVHEYGTFADMPYDLYIQSLQTHYPHLFANRVELEHYGLFSLFPSK
ncbi:MAG: transglutaminase family protein [Microscillaceae bacterium]|nr:transglutaminase family protein [Microscillaceae bacterium]